MAIRTVLTAAAIMMAVSVPVQAQGISKWPAAPRNPMIIKNPPSMNQIPGPTVPTTSSTTSMYPKPIKRPNDPYFRNPTARNQNLTQ